MVPRVRKDFASTPAKPRDTRPMPAGMSCRHGSNFGRRRSWARGAHLRSVSELQSLLGFAGIVEENRSPDHLLRSLPEILQLFFFWFVCILVVNQKFGGFFEPSQSGSEIEVSY